MGSGIAEIYAWLLFLIFPRILPVTCRNLVVNYPHPGEGAEMSKEIDNSIRNVATDLRSGNVSHAIQEVQQSLLSIERSSGPNSAAAAKNESEYFAKLMQTNEEMKKLGFPSLTLTQEGDKIVYSSDVKRPDGSSTHYDGYTTSWTSFTRSHPREAHHKISGADFMQEMTAKEDSTASNVARNDATKPFELKANATGYRSDETPYGAEVARTAPANVAMYGRVNDFVVNVRPMSAQNGPLDYQKLQNIAGPRLVGQQDSYTAEGTPLNTSISLPANLQPGMPVAGQLRNGDPISGAIVQYTNPRTPRRSDLYFDGQTTPRNSAHSEKPVQLHIPLQ